MKHQLPRIFKCLPVVILLNQEGTRPHTHTHTQSTAPCVGLISERSALIISRSSSILEYLTRGCRAADERPTVNKGASLSERRQHVAGKQSGSVLRAEEAAGGAETNTSEVIKLSAGYDLLRGPMGLQQWLQFPQTLYFMETFVKTCRRTCDWRKMLSEPLSDSARLLDFCWRCQQSEHPPELFCPFSGGRFSFHLFLFPSQ